MKKSKVNVNGCLQPIYLRNVTYFWEKQSIQQEIKYIGWGFIHQKSIGLWKVGIPQQNGKTVLSLDNIQIV